jgi:hypothetical protein
VATKCRADYVAGFVAGLETGIAGGFGAAAAAGFGVADFAAGLPAAGARAALASGEL